jgi:solute carrier family 34 (sodium-dependent phosphate cotransporter)
MALEDSREPTTTTRAEQASTKETHRSSRLSRAAGSAWRVVRLLAALYLFIGALQILKTGAGGLAAVDQSGILIRNAGSTFGLGWIGAMLTLSGSTMATTGLTLRATGTISEIQGFTMVTGARLGAAFVVLLVAVVYALRNPAQGRRKTVSTAILALVITAVIYLPGAVIGFVLLSSHIFSGIHLSASPQFGGLLELLYDWLLVRIESLPSLVLFFGGVVLLVIAFKSVDALVPELDETRLEGRLEWLRRKWPMFFLGIVVVIATLSVSVALTVLVPLVAKGYVKREQLIPYIIGADLGTLVDKLLIAFVVGVGSVHPSSPPRIIIAELIGTSMVGFVIMAFFYLPMRYFVWRFQRQVTKSQLRLALFTVGLLATPIAIIGLAAIAG